MSKIKDIAYDLAQFICRPVDGIEISGVSSQLLDILRIYTRKNDRLREQVHDYIEFMIETDDLSVDEYDGNAELAKKDYDKLFY